MDGRLNGVRAAEKPDPCLGGNAYSQDTRKMILQIWKNGGGLNGGFDALMTPHYMQLRFQQKSPHENACKRIVETYLSEGHILPKRPNGNHYAERELFGIDLFNLSLFRLIRPKATIDEVRAFVHNRNPSVLPYSHSQIYRAEQRVQLWRKVASTTSEQAYRPVNLRKRKNYWEKSYPDGVHGEDAKDMIDIDEAGFKLESQDRKRGKTVRWRRCDARGKYKKGEKNVSLLMGISGDDDDPFEFHQQFSEGGTTLWRFYSFMVDFIDWLDVNRPGRTFCFTMDNLNIHRHATIINLIEDAGHRIVFRAPYWSCDGAIEYVFNTLHMKLQMDDDNRASTVEELIDKIDDIIFAMSIVGFAAYFEHVGFSTGG